MVKRILKDKFLKNNLVFFVGTVAVAFLNYLYHPILGRMMRVEDFGEVQAFLSFLLIFGVFTGFFRNVITTVVSNLKDEDDKEVIAMLKKASLLLAIFISLFLILFGSFLTSFFNFSSYYYFVAFAILIIVGVVNSNNQAIIQGLGNFKVLSIAGIITSLIKLLFSILFVWLGWAVFGAIGAIILSSLVATIYVVNYNHKNFKIGSSFNVKIDRRIKKELWYAFLFLTVSLSIAFLYSSDVVVMKKYFSSETAGLYSGLAIVGRIIFFLVASIPNVLLPAIKVNDLDGENKRILIKSVCLTGVLGGGALFVFCLFPDLVVKILIGSKYSEYAHLLPEISLYLFFVSFSNLFFYYLLALRRSYIILPAIVGPLTLIGLCFINHSNVDAIVSNFFIGSLVTFILLLVKIIGELSAGRRK